MGNVIVRKLKNGLNFCRKYGLRATLHEAFIDDYAIYSKLPPEKYEGALKRWYKRYTGEELDLENPRTYCEKLQWLKLYDSTPLKTRLADKYLVREWVKEKIGEDYLIPLLGVWDDFDEIDFDKLPDQFVLKATHGCKWNIVVRDKSKFVRQDARKKFKKWLHTNYAFAGGFEMQYKNMRPRVIAEAYVQTRNDDLHDYKVMCFAGRAEGIVFMSDRETKMKLILYDFVQNSREYAYSHFLEDVETLSMEQLERIIQLAECLSEGFPHVRVDFYALDDGSVKFGEMTFSSASGLRYLDWITVEQDCIFGDLIHLPAQKSPIP